MKRSDIVRIGLFKKFIKIVINKIYVLFSFMKYICYE